MKFGNIKGGPETPSGQCFGQHFRNFAVHTLNAGAQVTEKRVMLRYFISKNLVSPDDAAEVRLSHGLRAGGGRR